MQVLMNAAGMSAVVVGKPAEVTLCMWSLKALVVQCADMHVVVLHMSCRRTLAAVHSGADLSAAIDGVLGYDAGECKGRFASCA